MHLCWNSEMQEIVIYSASVLRSLTSSIYQPKFKRKVAFFVTDVMHVYWYVGTIVLEEHAASCICLHQDNSTALKLVSFCKGANLAAIKIAAKHETVMCMHMHYDIHSQPVSQPPPHPRAKQVQQILCIKIKNQREACY
jgi:hypothetical protein